MTRNASIRTAHGEPFKVFTAAVLMIVVSFLYAFSASAQDSGRFLRWSYQDGSALLHDLRPHAPIAALGGGALLLSGGAIDAPVLAGVQQYDRGVVHDYLAWTNELGSTKMVPVAAGVFGASLLTDDTRFQDAAFTSLQSIVYANAAAFGLKYTVGRFRPEEDLGADAFDMFSGNASFPSGHTATAFAMVTPWIMYYPGPVSYAMLALPVGTAVARIAKDRHWPTDVLAGAAIGYMTARYLSERHLENASSDERPRIQITPAIAPDAVGLNIRVDL